MYMHPSILLTMNCKGCLCWLLAQQLEVFFQSKTWTKTTATAIYYLGIRLGIRGGSLVKGSSDEPHNPPWLWAGMCSTCSSVN